MSPSPRTVALHLGAHKTATTHLQSVLEQSASTLDEAGIAFVGPRDLRGAGKTLFDRFPGSRKPTADASTRPAAEELAALANGAAHLVLSEENYLGPTFPKGGGAGVRLYAQAEARVSRLVDLLAPVPVTLFLAIRDPAGFLVSLYGQSLMGGKIDTFDAFLGQTEPIDLSWLDLLVRLSEVKGLAGIVVWRFEEYAAVQPSLFERLLGQPMFHELARVQRRPNEGLSRAAVQDTLRRAAAGETGPLATQARAALPVGPRHPAHTPFSAGDLRASARIYGLEVDEIAKLPKVGFLRPGMA